MIRSVTFSDGCGYTITALGQLDARVFATKVDGWFEGADVRTESINRIGDGQFPSELWRTGRKITLAVTQRLSSEEETDRAARAVSQVFRSGEIGEGVLTVAGIGPTLSAHGLELDGRPKVSHNLVYKRVEWELPLLATDPYLYGDVQRTLATTGSAGQGLEYPLFDDQETGVTTGVLEYGEAPPPPAELVNDGNQVAFPVVTVSGSFPNGFAVDVITGGHVYGVTYRSTVSPVSPVRVDFAGDVTVGGSDQSWALVRRDWGGVDPGGRMTVRLTALSAEGAGSAEVALRSTYL